MDAKVQNLMMTYGNNYALQDINITVHDGEFLAILGPSGCGKTTLLRLLAGFLKPTSGDIYIGGELVASASTFLSPRERNLGMVFQNYALWPHMTVRKNIEFPIINGKTVSKQLKNNIVEKVNQLIDIVGLQGLDNRYPSELSGGQRQRVALARALASEPKLLLMDEPLSNLDAELKVIMREEIRRIHKETNTTVIYVTHDQQEALSLADKMVILHKGNLQQIGSPQEIYHYPVNTFVAKFVGRTNFIHGSWHQNKFTAHGSDVTIEREKVSLELKKQGVLPVKPEEITLTNDVNKPGIGGEICSVEFQGRDMKYDVKLDTDDIIEVLCREKKNFALHEKVHIEL